VGIGKGEEIELVSYSPLPVPTWELTRGEMCPRSRCLVSPCQFLQVVAKLTTTG